MKKQTIFGFLMPSIADIIFLRIFFNVLGNATSLLYDGDTGWHIVTGETILKTFRIPFHDPYSHTLPNTNWTAHEWLAEVIFAFFHRLMGLNGLIIFSATLIALTFFLLFRYLLHKNVSLVIAAFISIIAIWASTLHWLARPHIFSFLFTLGFIVILERYQREGRDTLYLLPVLMVLWVNLHGGYIFGLILLLVYIGGNFLISTSLPEKREGARKAYKKLAYVLAFTLLATFVNPQGPAILYFPFHLIGRQFIMDNVAEWLSPNFHKLVVFEVMLLLFFLTLVLTKKKLDVIELGLFFLLTHMSLYSTRYIPLLAIIVTPIVAPRFIDVLEYISGFLNRFSLTRDLPDIFEKISANVSSLEFKFTSHFWVYAAVVITFVIGLNGGKIGNKQVLNARHDKERFPVEALDFAMSNNIEGKMFNNDGWGGYIIYKSFPRFQVFMDGRSDMYGEPVLREYVKIVSANLGYAEVLDKYGVTWVLFNANSPICQLLAASGNWKLVYADQTANILLKNVPENHSLIERFPDVQFVPKDE
jgi:hypothetical protein